MRVYGVIHTKFWTDDKIQSISDQAKLLANYLLSSSHTNMLGCFRIPLGYIAEDLKWDLDKVLKALAELSKINFIIHDKTNNWVIITNFLKYHSIENPNQGKSIEKLFSEIPKNLSFISHLMNQLLKQQKYLHENFISTLVTLSKPFANQEQNQKQEQKQELFMSGKPDVVIQNSNITLLKSSHDKFNEQAIEVLNFLNNKTGKNYRAVDSNLKLIVARLKSGATVMDCRQVIAKKKREWGSDAKMVEYLRPATLFNAVKFEQYMGELVEQEEEPQNGTI